jgi:NADH-quinone oxidoreductase subunit E/NADP-reducing hydrogenase subunit HndA
MKESGGPMGDKGNILVVDDEQIVLKSCERVLAPHGYEVETTTSPKEALSLVKSKDFDLVITDFKMPEMDGLELIRQIREAVPDLNIVLITGFPSQESIKEALAMRIIDYLPKPFSPSLLLEVVQNALNIKKHGAAPQPEVEDYNEEVAAKLDDIIQKNRNRPGALIPVLQAAQYLVGYLPPVVQRHIAKGLNVPVSEVHGVVSFYSFFSMKPRGKYSIRICLGTACYVKRAEEIADRLKKELSIDIGEVTPDREFSLESVRCLGACGLAPVVVVNEDTYGSVNPVKTHEILDKYRNGNGGGGNG